MDFIKRNKGALGWILGTVMALFSASFAQAKGSGSYQTLERDVLKSDYSALLASDSDWKALVDGAASIGYTLTNRWSNGQWGLKGTLDLNGQAVTVTWYVYDLDQLGSPDAAALQYLSNGNQTYRAMEVAQNRDPASVKEFTMAKVMGSYRLVPTRGFWACLKNGLQSNCGESCGSAFINCNQTASIPIGAFSLANYFGCMSDSCGFCLLSQAVSCALH